jgi:hypothetical protein
MRCSMVLLLAVAVCAGGPNTTKKSSTTDKKMEADLVAAGVRFSSVALPGFYGIPWGTTADAAKRAMLAHEGVLYVGTSPHDTSRCVSDSAMFVFRGGTFAGDPVEEWRLLCDVEGLCEANVILAEPVDTNIFGHFLRVFALIKEKYGEPSLDVCSISPKDSTEAGKKASAAKRVEAIKDNRAIISGSWAFRPASEDRGMWCLVTRDVRIQIIYRCGALLQPQMERCRKKKTADL